MSPTDCSELTCSEAFFCGHDEVIRWLKVPFETEVCLSPAKMHLTNAKESLTPGGCFSMKILSFCMSGLSKCNRRSLTIFFPPHLPYF